MNMEKEAQRRSALKWLGRALNPMEWVRYLGSESYREISDRVDDIDNQMREEAKSQVPGIRDALHDARMAMKNREFPKVMYYAWKIIDSMDNIFNRVGELTEVRDRIISEHYGTGLSGEELSEMHKQLQPTQAELERLLHVTGAPDPDALISEAGPLQWIQEHIPTYRQMESSLLERLFRNQLGKQKESARNALRVAEKAYKSIKDVFRKLDSARRNPNEYIQLAERYKKDFAGQKNDLSKLYQANFSEAVAQKLDEEAKAEQAKEKTEPAGEGELRGPTAVPEDEPEAQPEAAPAPEGEAAQPEPQEAQPQEAQPEAAPESVPQEEQEPQQAAAAAVVNLVRQAKESARKGDKGISSALLVRASEICDDYGAVDQSITLIQAAETVLKGDE